MIAAMSPKRVIGSNNRLPWHVPEDMQHFKQTTMGHTVVMGRKTFEAIGRPLAGRRNIILTSNPAFTPPAGSLAVPSLAAALEASRDAAKVFLIGGERVFREGLPLVQTLILSVIETDIAGDAYFPLWDAAEFRLISRQQIPAALPLTILIYTREALRYNYSALI